MKWKKVRGLLNTFYSSLIPPPSSLSSVVACDADALGRSGDGDVGLR